MCRSSSVIWLCSRTSIWIWNKRLWGELLYYCFPEELSLSPGVWISVWVCIKWICRFLLSPWGCPKHTLFIPKWSMSAESKSTFFFHPPEGDSLDPCWCASPLSLQMRKWVLLGVGGLFSFLLKVITSRVSEGNGWSYGPGGYEVDGVCGQEAASSTNEPGGVVENSRPVRCC